MMSAAQQNAYPTVSVALCHLLERLLNRLLRYDPATEHQLRQLAGKAITLSLTEPNAVVTLYFTEAGVCVSPLYDPAAACSLEGPSRGFWALLLNGQRSLAGSPLRLSGETGFLFQLTHLVQQAEFDWEAPWVELLGVELGPLAARAARFPLDQGRHFARRAPHFIERWLTQELALTPDAHALSQFAEAVDQLRDDTARLAARVQRLQQAIAPAP